MLGFAGISSFTVSTAAWRAARKKIVFWVGKIIFLKLETSDCWDLMGFLLLWCLLSKRLVVLAYIGGLSFFFLPYRFGGVGDVFLLVYRLVESIYLLCLAVSRLKGV